jgi:hypothetical protein
MDWLLVLTLAANLLLHHKHISFTESFASADLGVVLAVICEKIAESTGRSR